MDVLEIVFGKPESIEGDGRMVLKLKVGENYNISLASFGKSKNWADWDIKVYKDNEEITFNIFPECRDIFEVPATADNLMYAIAVCKELQEEDTTTNMINGWVLREMQWADLTEEWFITKSIYCNNLFIALQKLNRRITSHKNVVYRFEQYRWLDECDTNSSSLNDYMWQIVKITS